MSFRGQQIRRYANRKLYSVTESKHITLPEIAKLFEEGCGFVISDVKTNNDITVEYLVKALVSIGHFDEAVKDANLIRIERNLQEQGISVHG
tara:strand:- start:129 stop:404 length:276 start_codon:yes stop_codon:yes gene_type:complete